jgi:predicted esterase
MRILVSALLASSAIVLSACGSATDGAGGTTTPAADAGPAIPTRLDDAQKQLDAFTCPTGAPALVDGVNATFTAGGRTRGFHLALPKNAGTKPVGVVFAWHGVGDNITNFRRYFGPNPDARADFPVAVVTPMCVGCAATGNSPGLLPNSTPKGITWDIFTSQPGDGNLEAALFEGVLGCLKGAITIDPAHVHSIGFSGGAIVSGMLHARYPKLIHSVVQLSGAWFNNADTTAAVRANLDAAAPTAAQFGFDLSGINLEWNAFAAGDRGAVLATHGGASDRYAIAGFLVIDFETSFGFAKPFLGAGSRGVVDCPHGSGHTPAPYVGANQIMDFLEQNPLTNEATAPVKMPASLGTNCTVN